MAEEISDEKKVITTTYSQGVLGGKTDTESPPRGFVEELPSDILVEKDLHVTEDDLIEAKALADHMSLEEAQALMKNVLKIHNNDPNFPFPVLEKIKAFLGEKLPGDEAIFENPEEHEDIIYEMKLEAALITNNSPYAEVRAVVDNHDDPNTPVSTIRAWVIGLGFSILLAFINQLFSIRQPSITVLANVAQLLAFPIGKAWERWLPDWGFALFGSRISLNPGPFNKKEHMVITIMANVAYQQPYTSNIIWAQYLPTFFNQSYAGQFSYQILIALSTNFIGYGIAGLTRRFLVYPSYCVWPASLVTIALNAAFHSEKNHSVPGPFKTSWRMSRLRFFLWAFGAMFVYFWFPQFIFNALSVFSWMSWIAPEHRDLNTIVGMNNGLGLNPWATWDWNTLLFDQTDPLMVPFFATLNKCIGTFVSGMVILAVWYTNTWWTGHLPINSNRVYDNTASRYNVQQAIDKRGIFDPAKYEAYSMAFLSAGNILVYLFFFAIYPATIVYIGLYHRYDIKMGFVSLWNSLKWKKKGNEEGAAGQAGQYQDVHNRLMAKYSEVPEWWYLICLVLACAFGVAGIAGWETYTTPGVVFYGVALCLFFVVPVGIVKAMTGIEVTLNVIAEFIGGSWVAGNALAMNFFKSYGYVTCAHAVWFANDLKLAHYVKIPPRITFWAQMVATLVSTFVCTGVLNFQMNQIPGVCTPKAPNRFTCPGINTFFTASVLWGTIGPSKVFGFHGQYAWTLIGFPIGFALPVIFWAVQRKWHKAGWLRQIHPVAMLYGCLFWAPYNLSYAIPPVPIAWLSWIYLKKRFLGFWSKYNFVLSASFSSAIAIAAIIIFFTLQWSEVQLDWWGNSVVYQGCEDDACVLYPLGENETFGPPPGSWH